MWCHQMMVLGINKSQTGVSLTLLVLLIWKAKLKFSTLRLNSVLRKTHGFIKGITALDFVLCLLILLHEPSQAFTKQIRNTNRNLLWLKHKHFCSFFPVWVVGIIIWRIKFNVQTYRKTYFKIFVSLWVFLFFVIVPNYSSWHRGELYF